MPRPATPRPQTSSLRPPPRVAPLASILLALILPAGCAHPGPRLAPARWLEERPALDGGSERRYDLDGDDRADAAEVLDREGRVRSLRFVQNAQNDALAAFGPPVPLAAPADSAGDLILALDSIPFDIAAEAWEQGRLRMFPRPSRVVAPFPALTDPCLSEVLHCSPTPGPESDHFDGRRATRAALTYALEENSPWARWVDYQLLPIQHVLSYTDADPWLDHELGRIQSIFTRTSARRFLAYVVGTSAIGHAQGRAGHQRAVDRVDRMCRQILFDTRGRVRITLFSDHGHNLIASRRLPLAQRMAQLGYRVGQSLAGPRDLVVPEFGVISCASIYTPDPEPVARDAARIEGVELTAFLDSQRDRVVVVSREGEATIEAASDRLRYAPIRGDPLQIGLGPGGLHGPFVELTPAQWFERTALAEYPDAVYRLWRAFHGLLKHTPQVLVSLEEGWCAGSDDLARRIPPQSVHGNLRRAGSTGFAATTAGPLPPAMRNEDLRQQLANVGVFLPGPER